MTLRLALMIAVVETTVWACTIGYVIIPVGPNFQVKAEDGGRPVKGARVALSGASDAVAATGADGLARFRRLPPGNYDVGAVLNNKVQARAFIEVTPTGPTGVTVPLMWTDLAPIPVRSLKGVIRGPDFLPGQPQPERPIDLLEAESRRVRKSFHTNVRGEFDVEGVSPGLYFLELKFSGERIAIDLNPAAKADRLDLDVGWSSCGLWYSDASKCPRDTLETFRIAGQVVDSTGASIAEANIKLFDRDDVLVEQLQSDGYGSFSAQPSRGTYQLVVTRPGFTPLRRTISLSSTSGAAQSSHLKVQLGVLGQCSIANSH